MLTYNKSTPILFVISDNETFTGEIFEKIKKVAPEKLYIAGDWPELEVNIGKYQKNQEIVSHIDWNCKFKTRFNKKHAGYDKTVYQAISWFFTNEPEGIILEDLHIPSDDFFGFCSALLEKYRHDDRIGHIAGQYYTGQQIDNEDSYSFSSLINIYGGWASWKRVWKDMDKPIETLSTFKKLKIIEKTDSVRPFKTQWESQFKWFLKKKDGWPIKYQYLQLINNRLSIVPNVNLIRFVYTKYTENENKVSDTELIHPSFIVGDTISDWKAQEVLFSYPGATRNHPDGYSFMQNQLALFTDIARERMKIPKIIHQIYEDPTGPSKDLLQLAETWKEHHPDWEYRFWDKQAINDFLESTCPDFIEHYRNFPFNVQRWDAIRYLILYHIGGLYVDLDYECLQPLEPLLVGATCCMGMEPSINNVIHSKKMIIGNALMASVPEHNYFKKIIREITVYHEAHENDADEIMETTGPFMVTRVYEQYKKKYEVTLLPADLVTPLTIEELKLINNDHAPEEVVGKIEKAFAVHYFLGSWVSQTKKSPKDERLVKH